MGNALATEKFLATPLSRQRDFPFVIHPRYCKSHETTLVLRDNFWARNEPFAITAVGSDRTLFYVQRTFTGPGPTVSTAATDPSPDCSDAHTKWLVDAFTLPVARMASIRTFTTAYDVFVGREHVYKLTQLEIHFMPLHNNPCMGEIQNLDTGERSRVGVHGIWRQRTAFIYLDRGAIGERRMIARVCRPISDQQQQPERTPADFSDAMYHVTIARGVDIAFIVLVCGALDDALQQALDAR